MKKTATNFLLLENKQLNSNSFRIVLQSPDTISTIYPGQFVNVRINDSSEVFLRRPFSILDVDYANNTISLLIKILGRGSRKLTESPVNKNINAIFPLGKSFTLPEKNDKILLVGGGSGVAPMLFLAKVCGLPPENVSVLIGARTVSDHIDVSAYAPYGQFFFTTEDGSLGEKGFVTNHSVFLNQLDAYSRIYTCGPNPMMKAIGRIAIEKNISCEVSLENMMACGFGACLCCVEDTKEGHKCVCSDGPVFNVNDLKW